MTTHWNDLQVLTNIVDTFKPPPIVKFNDIEGLASELIKMMNCSNKERKSIGLRLTNRIIEEYPIEKMVKAYNTVYETLISDS